MIIITAKEANEWSSLKKDIYNRDFEIAKEALWHQIKLACLTDKYEVTWNVYVNKDTRKRLFSLFKEHGYNVVDTGTYFVISWDNI